MDVDAAAARTHVAEVPAGIGGGRSIRPGPGEIRPATTRALSPHRPTPARLATAHPPPMRTCAWAHGRTTLGSWSWRARSIARSPSSSRSHRRPRPPTHQWHWYLISAGPFSDVDENGSGRTELMMCTCCTDGWLSMLDTSVKLCLKGN